MTRVARPAAALAAAALVLGLAQALTTPSPWLLPEERWHADAARSLLGDGRDAFPTLWSLLLAPVWSLGTDAGSAVARALGALALALAVLPTWALARAVAPPRAGALATAVVVVAGSAVYTPSLLPAGAGVLVVACAALALVRGAASPRGRAPLAGAALAVAAAALWPPLLPFALVAAAVAASLRHGAAAFARWPGASVFVVGAGAAYAGYHLGRRSDTFARAADAPLDVLAAAAAALGSFAAGLGAVPLVLALAAAAAAPRRVASLLALGGLAGLALAAGALAVGRGSAVDDTPLVGALPLVAPLAAAALARRPPAWALAAATAVVVALAAAARWRLDEPEPRAAGAALADRLAISPLALTLLVLAAAAAAVAAHALAVGSRGRALRSALPLAAALALPVALGAHLLAWDRARDRSSELRAALGGAPSAVDEAAGGERVLVLGAGALGPDELETLLFWTPRAHLARPPLAARATDPETGAVDPPLAATELALVPPGERELVAERVASLPVGTLVRPAHPTRVAETVEGVHPDGWSGPRVVYRRFAAGGAGALVVRVSRERWGGPHVGGDVRVHVGPLDGETGLVTAFPVPERAAREVELDVPRAPFVVVLELPTFSPAAFGEADGRVLGAEVSFRLR